jgi:uncharacterized protein YdaU (DUF1376 family)
MAKMRYFKCYPDNFLNGTATLNEEQFTLYVRLFMFMYDQGGAVPFDTKKLKNVLHKRPQDIRRLVDQLVTMGKLQLDAEGLIHQGRTEQMIAKWPGNGGEMKRHSSANGASKEPKSADNSTRAPARDRAFIPEARSLYKENLPSHSTASARTLQGSLLETLRQHREMMSHDDTKAADPKPEVPPSDRRGGDPSPGAPGRSTDDDAAQ